MTIANFSDINTGFKNISFPRLPASDSKGKSRFDPAYSLSSALHLHVRYRACVSCYRGLRHQAAVPLPAGGGAGVGAQAAGAGAGVSAGRGAGGRHQARAAHSQAALLLHTTRPEVM